MDNASRHGPLQAAQTCLVVYAPFGDDYALSRYPGETLRWREHPLVASLSQVAVGGEIGRAHV